MLEQTRSEEQPLFGPSSALYYTRVVDAVKALQLEEYGLVPYSLRHAGRRTYLLASDTWPAWRRGAAGEATPRSSTTANPPGHCPRRASVTPA